MFLLLLSLYNFYIIITDAVMQKYTIAVGRSGANLKYCIYH